MMKFDWDHFKIGDTKTFVSCYRQSVIASFRSFCSHRFLNWEIKTESVPKTPVKGSRCLMVKVTRINPEEARANKPPPGMIFGQGLVENSEYVYARDGKKFLAYRHSNRRKRPMILDIRSIPEKDRAELYAYKQGKIRRSQYQWEMMEPGDYIIAGSRLETLRSTIVVACVARGLLWRWEIARIQNPSDVLDDREHWLVTRIT